MSFYGNIINYFSAAFKKFKFKNGETDLGECNPTLSADVLTFDSTGDNYIEYEVKTSGEGSANNKEVNLKLNLDAIRNDLTVTVESNPTNDLPESYIIQQGEKNVSKEIKYYAKYDENTGNLHLPFIHFFKEETE